MTTRISHTAFSVLGFVESTTTRFIAVGLALFPTTWLVVVIAQSAYFGPMRSIFTKVSRRYLDTLPFGWGLFELLFYGLPLVGYALVAFGLYQRDNTKALRLLIGASVVVVVVLVTKQWSPGYL